MDLDKMNYECVSIFVLFVTHIKGLRRAILASVGCLALT
jgi:hypothetical protein